MKNRLKFKSYIISVLRIMVLISALIFPSKVSSQSLLWRITGNNLSSPSYLYGTIHVKDKRVFTWKDSVFSKINLCEAFAGEIDLSTENLMKAAGYMVLPEGQTLHDRFSQGEYALIQEAVKSCSGYELSVFDKLKPAVLIALCFMGSTSDALDATVDELLYQKAVKYGKKTIGIETVEEQAALLDKIPDTYVLAYFKNLNEQQEELERLINCYRRADLDSLLILMQDEESGVMLNDELIRIRNYRMTERVIPMIRQQSTFVAIGSGHLPGKEGVIALLKQEGYVVEPVKIVW